MKTKQKESIAVALKIYCDRYDSQNQAATSLKAVSSATISQILNNNWDLIKDTMWRNVASQIGYVENQWQAVETNTFKEITHLLSDAQTYSNVFAITGNAGTGKSFALKQYVASHKRAFLLSCNEYWNRNDFLKELLTTMGRDYSGLTVSEMMSEAVRILKSQDQPIIMMDEADKLSDQVMFFFITIYNQLEDHCGIVLIATDHLEKRIKRGMTLNRKGYKEIYSRVGRNFIELNEIGITDVAQVCHANNIKNKAQIKDIFKQSEGDLRRVKRKIHALIMKES